MHCLNGIFWLHFIFFSLMALLVVVAPAAKSQKKRFGQLIRQTGCVVDLLLAKDDLRLAGG
jgi:hypothetical protein